MNPGKFIHETNQALASAHELAISNGHVQHTPVHLAIALLSDSNSLFCRAIVIVACNTEAANSVERVLIKALKSLPTKTTPPTKVRASTSLTRINDLFKEDGVATSSMRAVVEKLQGKDGKLEEHHQAILIFKL
ncbi:hypothetical protein Nepgr_027714 [Nepenthes gracilis]|uniref:Clp R domain-containing protein n=1 Tax=Nepenthes gracilis TaxID=150966 RepID=A0AAD3TB11_NEPGR|nr:hypothetical protein Nepgr_027714 [Nepenthes gracilis]